MWSITRKLMKSNATMLIPAGIAIFIGTVFIASTLLLGNSLNYSMRQQISASYGEANYAIGPEDDDTASYVDLSEFHLDQLEQIDGVEGTRPDISCGIEVINDDTYSSGLLITYATDSSLMPVSLADGDWPEDGDIVIPQDMASRLNVSIGDTVDVDAYSDDGTVELTISGLSVDPLGAYSYTGGAAVTTYNTLITLLDPTGDIGINSIYTQTVYLLLDEQNGSVDDTTLEAINNLLPTGFTVFSRSDSEDNTLKQMGGGDVDIITTFMMVFGVLALFVAALVIANTFQVLVAQRRRTLALLRTIGATKKQLYASVIIEAIILGLISSAVAVAASIGIMSIVSMCDVDIFDIELTTVPTPQVFIIPIGFAVVVTVLASLSSAHTATSVTPLEALQPIGISDTRTSNTKRQVISTVMMVVGAVVAAFTVIDTWRYSNGETSLCTDNSVVTLLAAMAAVMLFFLGLLLCANRWVPLLLKGIGTAVSHIGASSTLAAANIHKNPRRVAATSAALLIGVTLVATLGTGAASARQTVADALDDVYSVDIQISGESVDSTLLDTVRNINGVDTVELVSTNTVVWHQGDWDTELQVYALTAEQGRNVMNGDAIDELTDGTLLVPNTLAGDNDDYTMLDSATLDLDFNVEYDDNYEIVSSTPLDLTVKAASFRGVYSAYIIYGLALPETLEKASIEPDGYEIWVKTDGNVTAATVMNDIQTALSDYSGISVVGSIAERVSWDSMVNTILIVLVALLAVAVIIALIGVANTLSLSVIERTRESATLRAIGMTRSQLRRSLAVEAVLISLVAGVVGIVLGTIFGWIGSYIVFTVFSYSVETVALPFDWTTAAAILVIAVIAALLASILPARRAVKVPPVEALAEA